MEQPQAASRGSSASRCAARVRRTRPREVKAVPCQARVVGRMQSNMSTPVADGLQDVGRRAHAHEVAGPVGRERPGGVGHHLAPLGAGVAHRHAADGEAVEGMAGQELRRLRAGARGRARPGRWRTGPGPRRGARPGCAGPSGGCAPWRRGPAAAGRWSRCTRRAPSSRPSRARPAWRWSSRGRGRGGASPRSCGRSRPPRRWSGRRRGRRFWKPPESVRTGPSQRMNRWMPPRLRKASGPGRSRRW